MPPTGCGPTRRDTLDRPLMTRQPALTGCPRPEGPGSGGSDPGPPSSLDNLETNPPDTSEGFKVVSLNEQTDPVPFRHSGWTHDRKQVRAAIAAGGGRIDRLIRWDACGSNRWLVRSKSQPDVYEVHADLCRDRFCKPCASARSRTIAGNLAEKMASRRHRLITLTIRSEQEPLADLLNLLYDSFRTLRRTELWRQRIQGGACFLEIKYNVDLDRWHPHLHIIAEGHYIEVGHLALEWQRITVHSCIVDVRMIRTHEKAIRYVSKYASKPLSRSYVDDHNRLCEAVTALTGRRLCMTFGLWRGWKLLKETKSGPWQYIASMKDVVREAIDGSAWHLALLHRVGLDVVVERTRPPIKMQRPPAETYLFR